jgi:hypothetical protein
VCWEGEAGARQPGEKSDFLSPRAGKSPLGRTNLIMVGFATVCVCAVWNFEARVRIVLPLYCTSRRLGLYTVRGDISTYVQMRMAQVGGHRTHSCCLCSHVGDVDRQGWVSRSSSNYSTARRGKPRCCRVLLLPAPLAFASPSSPSSPAPS